MVHSAQRRWHDASEAFGKAADLDPGATTYQVFLGMALYEEAQEKAREAAAAAQGRNPEDVEPDMSTVDLDPALSRLLLAVQQAPRLAGAQYYVGRIYRDQYHAREAAEAFTAAIVADPSLGDAYVALMGLYARWGYLDEAISVGRTATDHVVDALPKSNVLVVLGQALTDHGSPAEALAAFEAAVGASPDNGAAQFQLGQAEFKRNDFTAAKTALEAFLKSPAAGSDSMASSVANKMLLEIAAQHP
jgi:tetratricopeptide (TPR) repeat protein